MISLEARKGLRTWIELDRAALCLNINSLKVFLGGMSKIAAVVKSNAYGHSLIDFSREAEAAGIEWLAVDSAVEALALRREGIRLPILVLGYTLPELVPEAVRVGASITISHFEGLEAAAASPEPVRVHIKADTGMHRQGFVKEDITTVVEFLKQHPVIRVEGLYTHLAAAKDPAAKESAQMQLTQFDLWRSAFQEAGFSPICHALASGGAFLFPEARFDMMRVGAALYGLWPSDQVRTKFSFLVPLDPVLAWRTIISETKHLKAGERIGYDFTATLERDSVVAVCPIGYWHGYPRALSGKGSVLIRGKRAPVLGRVSMDMITVDVTDIAGTHVGDVATLIGKDGKEEITAYDLAALLGGSHYEVVTRINPLIKKIVV